TKLREVTTWCVRGNFRAHRIFEFALSVDEAPAFAITNDSIVMASLTELANGVPHSGAVTMKVCNVVATGFTNPQTNLCSGTVKVRGEIDSGDDVDLRISVLIANPLE